MNNDIEALKYLYSQMGGADDVASINTSSEMIAKIGDIVASGGGSGSAGGDTVLVEVANVEDTEEHYAVTLNKTPAELWPELQSGKTIILKDTSTPFGIGPVFCTALAYMGSALDDEQGGWTMIFGNPTAFALQESDISKYFIQYSSTSPNEPFQYIVTY